MLTSDVFGHLDESTQVGDEGYLWNRARYGIGQTWTTDNDHITATQACDQPTESV